LLTCAHPAWKSTSAPLFFCTSDKETVENPKISHGQLAPCQENRIKGQQTVSSVGCKVMASNSGFLLASMPSYCRFRPIECCYSQSVSVSVPQHKIRGSAIRPSRARAFTRTHFAVDRPFETPSTLLSMTTAAGTAFLLRPPPLQPPKVAAGGAAVDPIGHSPLRAAREAATAAAVVPHGGWRRFLWRPPPPPPCTSVNLGDALGGGGCSTSPLAISGVQRRTGRRDGGGGATPRAPASGVRDRRGDARDRHVACARACVGGQQPRRRRDDRGNGQRVQRPQGRSQGRQHGAWALQGEGVWEGQGGGSVG